MKHTKRFISRKFYIIKSSPKYNWAIVYIQALLVCLILLKYFDFQERLDLPYHLPCFDIYEFIDSFCEEIQ